MMAGRNELLDAVYTELHAAGAQDITEERRGRHYKVRFTHDGKRHLTVVSATTSDWRAVKNTRATVRRILRKQE